MLDFERQNRFCGCGCGLFLVSRVRRAWTRSLAHTAKVELQRSCCETRASAQASLAYLSMIIRSAASREQLSCTAQAVKRHVKHKASPHGSHHSSHLGHATPSRSVSFARAGFLRMLVQVIRDGPAQWERGTSFSIPFKSRSQQGNPITCRPFPLHSI